ncbi:UNVERIFIED_CONTAM: hypothetical protein GTU68_014591 [Idotea baltica]|nr:hypothetical protein [Idotea baltica]
MLSLLCIEPPISLNDPNSIRDEKVKVLRAMHRFKEEDFATKVVRGQYQAGEVNSKQVPSYINEANVSDDSKTETYVALKLEIDNWRWAGVPIYVRAGKRLPKRLTEITVFFQKTPETLFAGFDDIQIGQNQLRIQVQPNEGINLKINSKPPGPLTRVRAVNMDFNYGSSFNTASADAYERLILDAIKGEATLFTRNDEIEQAWSLLDPISDYWKSNSNDLRYYSAGTWGPKESDNLLISPNHFWRDFRD